MGSRGKDVFRRVLMALQPGGLPSLFRRAGWSRCAPTAAAATGVEQPVLAVDGKTARRSHDRKNGLGALHSVSVWASEFGLSLGQVACAEKSNEITAIPELLRLVDIKGAIITIDAMGAQKAIAAEIIDGEGRLRPGPERQSGDAASGGHRLHRRTVGERFCRGAVSRVTTEKGHGREETRTYLQMPAPEGLPGFGLWKGLKTIGVVTSMCIRDGKETVEVRYYISSLGMGVKRFAQAVRSHWGIENSCHWSPRFDLSRGRVADPGEDAAGELRLAAIASRLSLLKQHPDRTSVAMKRRSCGWNEEFLMQVLIILDSWSPDLSFARRVTHIAHTRQAGADPLGAPTRAGDARPLSL